MYRKNFPPQRPEELPAYLSSELDRIATELTAAQEVLRLMERAEAPVKYADGYVVYADGTNWNPGGGEDLYVRLAGAWMKPGRLYLTSKSADYTLTMAEVNGGVIHPGSDASARTFTIPANASVAYPLYTRLTFINENGGGNVSIAITSDTMRLAGAGTTGTRTLAADGYAEAIKIAATKWLIWGYGLT